MANWTIQFKNIKDEDVLITIGGCAEDEDVALTPGSNPIEIDGSDDDDVFTPVRTHSGKLTVIASVDVLTQMMSSSPLQRKVTVKVAGSVVWVGFLQTSSAEQTLWGVNEEVELPIICPLTALEGATLSTALEGNSMMMSVSQLSLLIRQAVGGAIQDIYFPEDISSYYVNRLAWLQLIEPSKRNNTGDRYEKAYYSDVLSDLCQSLGWCAEMEGEYLYLRDRTTEQTTSTEAELSTLTMRGTDHSMSYVQGKRSIKVTSTVDEPETSLVDTDIESNCNFKASYSAMNTGYSPADVILVNCYDNSTNMTAHWANGQGQSMETTNGTASSPTYGGTQLEEQGHIYTNESVIDYNLQFGMLFVRMYNATSMATARSFGIHLIGDDYITLPHTSQYRLTIEGTIKKKTLATDAWTTSGYTGYLLAKVKFGDYYLVCDQYDNHYVGPEWSTTEQLCWLKYTDNKLSLPYTSTFNQGLPIGGSGRLDVWLYPPMKPGVEASSAAYSPETYNSNYQLTTREMPNYMLLTDFRVEIKMQDAADTRHKVDNDNKYEQQIGAGFSDDYELTLPLTIRRGKQYGNNVWMSQNDIDSYDCQTSILGTQTPETLIGAKAYNYYQRSRMRIKATIDGDRPLPLSNVYTYQGKTFGIMAQSINYRDCENKITLQEIL